MNEAKSYRVPDVIDKIYNDIIYGLYSPLVGIPKENRTAIVKCNLACELLLKSDESENDIIQNLGFPSIEVFRDTFVSFLGILPLDFRDRFGDL